MKKFLKILSEGILITGALVFAKTLYQIKKFKVSCDINEDPLDSICYFRDKDITFRRRMMKDFKAGAFYGNLKLNLENMIMDKRVYDVYAECICGTITFILPPKCRVSVTGTERVINNLKENPDATTLLAITARNSAGEIILENA